MLKKLFTWSTVFLFGTYILDTINRATEMYPNLDLPDWAKMIITVLAFLLPGFLGFAHKMMTGEAQMPENRTAQEVVASALVTKTALVETAPAGTSVAVPLIETAVVSGAKV